MAQAERSVLTGDCVGVELDSFYQEADRSCQLLVTMGRGWWWWQWSAWAAHNSHWSMTKDNSARGLVVVLWKGADLWCDGGPQPVPMQTSDTSIGVRQSHCGDSRWQMNVQTEWLSV